MDVALCALENDRTVDAVASLCELRAVEVDCACRVRAFVRPRIAGFVDIVFLCNLIGSNRSTVSTVQYECCSVYVSKVLNEGN